jgi:hypothetical protein
MERVGDDRLVRHAEVIALKGYSYPASKDRDLGRIPAAGTGETPDGRDSSVADN